MSPEKSTMTDTLTDKDMSCNENKGIVVNTVKPKNETSMSSESAANDTPSKGPISTDLSPVNTEKTGEVTQIELASTLIEQDSDNTTNKNSVSAENSAVNTENNAANSEKDPNDNETKRQDGAGAPVTTENDTSMEEPTSNHVNTVSMTETDHEDSMATYQKPNGDDLTIQGHGELNVNSEKSPPNHDQPTTSTPKTHNHKMIKEDWSSLMFSSDDSLFDEMTKQLEDDTTRPKTDKKSSPSATSTITATSTSMQDQETLLDIVYTSSRTDAATGLLMLGADPKDVDAEIDNELVMPVNKPMQQDHNKLSTGDNNNNNNKQNKQKKKKGNLDLRDSPRRSTCQAGKPEPTTPKTTSTTSIFPSSPSSPGSPRGVLKVTHYKLRKGTPNKYVHKPLKCSMCDQAVNSKDELRIHHQEIHNIISCKECNKGFVTKESLRKHSYTHTSGNNYECILCKKFFTFPSELDAHMLKHDSLPNFSCNIVGCTRSYFRKVELTAHIKTHDGKLWKCSHKGCGFEAVDKRYLTAHKKKP